MDAWKTMTKDELELHYSPSRWSHRDMKPDDIIDEYVKNVTTASTQAKKMFKCTLGVSYGSTEREKLDIFLPIEKKSGSPVFVYIHGGYWQFLSREISSFMAAPLVEAGITFICVGYDIAPQASMEVIISQVNKAVEFVCQWAIKEESRGVYLGGHSAGGHLVAMALAHIAKSKNNEELSIIKAAMPMSGVYDLRPLVNTYVNDPIKLTNQEAWHYSPLNYIDDIIGVCQSNKIKVKVPVGEFDPPEFRKQSDDFCKRLCNAGVSAKYYCIKGEDHFTMNDSLRLRDFVLTQEAIDMVLN